MGDVLESVGAFQGTHGVAELLNLRKVLVDVFVKDVVDRRRVLHAQINHIYAKHRQTSTSKPAGHNNNTKVAAQKATERTPMSRWFMKIM